MGSRVMSGAKEFSRLLGNLLEETSSDPYKYEEDIQIVKMKGDRLTAVNMYCCNQMVFVCEKYIPKMNTSDDFQVADTSNCTDDGSEDAANVLQSDLGPLPLTLVKARQLLSWYTLAQNPSVSAMGNNPALLPLWVRCDMSDPAGTTWLGAETVRVGNKVTGVKLYSVTCKGSTSDKTSLMTLEDLKQEHKKRHLTSSMGMKGSARFNLFGSITFENTVIETRSCVTVDFKWSHVESVLEVPPLSSSATLNIKIASGDTSQMVQMYRELEFLQSLADCVRTGETEWMEPLESRSAVSLTKAYLEELQTTAQAQSDQDKKNETPKQKFETDTPISTCFLERTDLDFVEQLWVRLRKSITSFQDIYDSLKLVIEALRYSDIKPWIHGDSNSSLSKLILQSYHRQIDHVALTGVTPVNMLLEMGLDKMRKDYVNHLIGAELTTLNHLSYYLSSEVDLQEQVVRLRKLHHLVEIILSCSTFLALPYDRLFLLTQSCLQHYKTAPLDEEHEFKLQIKPGWIGSLYQNEHPLIWRVEVSSGHGPREVKTCLQLSDRPLVDHVIFETDFSNETVNGESEDPAFFSTMVSCSLVSFA